MDTVGALSSPVLLISTSRIQGEKKHESGFLEMIGERRRTCLTLYSIQTWALEEARRRLEAEGILEDPDSKK
jgi:hypothetical protein